MEHNEKLWSTMPKTTDHNDVSTKHVTTKHIVNNASKT
jgi:hypothetical protein